MSAARAPMPSAKLETARKPAVYRLKFMGENLAKWTRCMESIVTATHYGKMTEALLRYQGVSRTAQPWNVRNQQKQVFTDEPPHNVAGCPNRVSGLASRLVPALARVDHAYDREHHRNFDQHADHRRQRRAGFEAVEANGGCHSQLEEVRRADECGWASDAMCDTEAAIKPIRQCRIEQYLDENRHREHADHERLTQDRLALECEQQNYRGEQRGKRKGRNAREHRLVRRLAPPQKRPAPSLRQHQWNEDVHHDRQEQRVPRNADRRDTEQQRDDRREREDHDRVVQRHLR